MLSACIIGTEHFRNRTKMQKAEILRAMLLASSMLMMISVSAAQSFLETDRSGFEGETLTFKVDLGNADNSGNIRATALTVTAFQAKYPELEVPCGIDQETAAEENDFNGGSTVLVSQAGSNFVSVQFETTDDEKEELEERFVLILEAESGNGLQPLMHTVLRGGVEVNESICSVGIILESDRDAVSIRLDETLYNRTEDAGNVNLTIVRTGATELTQDVSILVTPCGRDELEELLEGEDIVISTKEVTLPPTDEEMTEYSVLVEIIDDDIPEPDECLLIKLVGSNIQGLGRADIVIVDDDDITVGVIESAVSVREGQAVEVCAAILEPLGEISPRLIIELDIALPAIASGGRFQVTFPFQMEPKFELDATVRSECIIVTAIDDEELEQSLTFSIEISAMTNLPRVTVEPDVVTVTITDNDGTPNRPEVTEVKLVNDDDLFIVWDVEEDELRPVDGYRGTVTETKPPESTQQPEVITFESEDKEETIQGIDVQKEYEIIICARNQLGFNCSEPVLFQVLITPEPEESGGLATGGIIAIVITLVLLLLCCCLLLLFLLLCCRRKRSKKYYQEKNENKCDEQYTRYRNQSYQSSVDSVEVEKTPATA